MSAHVVPLRLYLAVFASLLAFTALTAGIAFVDLGVLNTVAALGIASVKAALVLLYFMHVRWSGRVVRLMAVVGLLFLLILFAFSMADYATRDGVAGWE